MSFEEFDYVDDSARRAIFHFKFKNVQSERDLKEGATIEIRSYEFGPAPCVVRVEYDKAEDRYKMHPNEVRYIDFDMCGEVMFYLLNNKGERVAKVEEYSFGGMYDTKFTSFICDFKERFDQEPFLSFKLSVKFKQLKKKKFHK
jgi:hypothetical protein